MIWRNVDDLRLPILVFAFIAQAFLLLRLDWQTSPNRTEIGHMAASLRLSEMGTFDLFHANPPLLRMFVGLTVKAGLHPHTDWTDYSPNPLSRSEWATGVSFIRANDADTVRECFFLGRILCIPFILLGGYFGYRFARELFGDVSGFVFLTLWIFSPFILGWGATICPDVPSAALGIVALYIFRHWLRSSSLRLTFATGLILGLLPLMKLTWIIAFVMFPVIWLLAAKEKTFRTFGKLTLVILLALFMVNLGYLFDGTFKQLRDYSFHSGTLTNENAVNRFKNSFLGTVPIPLPEQFVLGFDTQRIDFEKGLPSYLFGQYSQHGWLHYYLAVLATKETLGTLALAALALFLCCFTGFRAEWRDEVILLVPMLTLFLLVSSQTGFSLHSRYMVPALPFFYLWISRTGRLLAARSFFLRAAVPVLLLSGCISSIWIYPYSMSYFNEAVGGAAQGHRCLLGSNVDWGQDLYELRDWLEVHPEVRPLYTAVSSIFPMETLDIRSSGNPPKWEPGQKPTGTWEKQLSIGPQPGWFLIGTNDLYGAERDYDWFHSLKPVKTIGYSLYLFHISLDEANRLREQDDLPKLSVDDTKNR